MKQVQDWLLKEGRLIPDALVFVETLCRKINQAGIPISRIRIGFKTIHPQMDVWAYTWTEEEGKASLWGGKHGIRLSESYLGSPAEWVHQNHATFRQKLTALDPEKDHEVLLEQARHGFTDYLMLPLDFLDASNAVISFVTSVPDGFSDTDIAQLEDLVNYIGPIIEVHATRKIAITLLDTYVGHRSGEKVMNGHIQRGDGETIKAALWFSDLRNYTDLSENCYQETVFELLNSYFETVSNIVSKHGGEILKFIGDAVLVIFPVDESTSPKQACEAALRSAEESFIQFEIQNAKRKTLGQPEIRFGIGLNYGEAIYGNVGSQNRLDFTVMGPAVNLTARLEELTKETGYALLLSQDFVGELNIRGQRVGDFDLKGISKKQTVFALPARELASG